MWMEIGAVTSIGVLAYQSLALHYERKALRRTRRWYEEALKEKGILYMDTDSVVFNSEENFTNAYKKYYHYEPLVSPERSQEVMSEWAKRQTQMCGGCGSYLTEEEIAKCPGKTCARFVEGELQSIFQSATNQIPPVGG